MAGNDRPTGDSMNATVHLGGEAESKTASRVASELHDVSVIEHQRFGPMGRNEHNRNAFRRDWFAHPEEEGLESYE